MKPRTLIRLLLCQLLMLGLLSYGLDLHCSFSPAGCDDARCCSSCFNPAHLSDTPAASAQIQVALAPPPAFELSKLMAEATALTGLADYLEAQVLAVLDPCLQAECVRGPPAQA